MATSPSRLNSKFNLYGQYGKNFKSPLGQYSNMSGHKIHFDREIETQTFKEIESSRGDLHQNPSEQDMMHA